MRDAKLFLILLLNQILAGPLALAMIIGGCLLGAGFSWLTGGSVKAGALIMGGLMLVVVIVLSIRVVLSLLPNFRGGGAYLYKTVWGSYIGGR